MITKDKITEIFCIADDFCKEFELETDKIGLSEKSKGCHRHRKWRMSKSEIITILICFHFNSYRNFRHYYIFFVKEHLADLFPNQLSYTSRYTIPVIAFSLSPFSYRVEAPHYSC